MSDNRACPKFVFRPSWGPLMPCPDPVVEDVGHQGYCAIHAEEMRREQQQQIDGIPACGHYGTVDENDPVTRHIHILPVELGAALCGVCNVIERVEPEP